MPPAPLTLAHRLAAVRARLSAACAAAGRPVNAVRLLAASKTRDPVQIAALHALGQPLFGENRAQEIRDKVDVVNGLAQAAGRPAPEWHFIGHLQTNKVKYVVGRVNLVHAVDRLDLAQALSERIARERAEGRALPDLGVLVEVNVSGEQSKGGVGPDGALALCAAVAALPGLALSGLMTMPPHTEDPADSRPFFAALAALAAQGRAAGLPLKELSMGMSGDFEHAVMEGSTMVRVGTDLFGPRG